MKILAFLCMLLVALPSHTTVYLPIAPGHVEITQRLALGTGQEPWLAYVRRGTQLNETRYWHDASWKLNPRVELLSLLLLTILLMLQARRGGEPSNHRKRR